MYQQNYKLLKSNEEKYNKREVLPYALSYLQNIVTNKTKKIP